MKSYSLGIWALKRRFGPRYSETKYFAAVAARVCRIQVQVIRTRCRNDPRDGSGPVAISDEAHPPRPRSKLCDVGSRDPPRLEPLGRREPQPLRSEFG